MLVFFVDIPADNFSGSFGAASYGEITLFDRSLFSWIKSSVFPLIDDEYIIFSCNKSYYNSSEIVCESNEKLIEILSKSNQKSVAFFYLDSFFVLDFDMILKCGFKSDCITFCDSNGQLFGGVFDKNYVLNLLNKKNNLKLKSLLELEKSIRICCVSVGFKLSNIKCYKNLCEHILSSGLCKNLPEIAQGIYSCDTMPKGDYTVIPPVYFGCNVQVESGAVIGPFSIIFDDTLVSRNSVVDNSILLNSCYVSRDCFLENCICCSNVSVRRASSIYSGAVIGSDCILSEETNVINNSVWIELCVKNDALNRLLRRSCGVMKSDKEEGITEIADEKFNIICRKSGMNNMKILLKASSFEVAEEIISDIDLL